MSRRTSKQQPAVAPLTARQIARMDSLADAFLLSADAESLAKRVAHAKARNIVTTPEKLLKNDRRRENHTRGVALAPRDGRAQVKKTDANHKDQIVKVDEDQLAECFRKQKENKKTWGDADWAQQSGFSQDPLNELEEVEEHELAAAAAAKLKDASLVDELRARADEIRKLKHALKQRNRDTLDLVLDGVSVAEIAAKKGQTVQAIYTSLRKIPAILAAAKSRQDWVREHCTITGTGDAPVVLKQNQQLGWDFGGAE